MAEHTIYKFNLGDAPFRLVQQEQALYLTSTIPSFMKKRLNVPALGPFYDEENDESGRVYMIASQPEVEKDRATISMKFIKEGEYFMDDSRGPVHDDKFYKLTLHRRGDYADYKLEDLVK